MKQLLNVNEINKNQIKYYTPRSMFLFIKPWYNPEIQSMNIFCLRKHTSYDAYDSTFLHHNSKNYLKKNET